MVELAARLSRSLVSATAKRTPEPTAASSEPVIQHRRRVGPTVRVVGAVAVCLFAAMTFAAAGNDGGWVAVDNIGQAAAALLAAVACLWASRRRPERQAPWRVLGAGAACWGAGQTYFAYFVIVRGSSPPTPSWGDAGFLTASLCYTVAVLLFVEASVRRVSRMRAALEGLIVLGSVAVSSYSLVIRTVVQHSSGGLVERVVLLAYPASDVLVLGVLLFAITAMTTKSGHPLLLVAVGMALLAVADSSYAWLVALGRYNGVNPIDTGWVAGFVVIAFAVGRPVGGGGADSVWTARRSRVPVITVVGACAVITAQVALGTATNNVTLALVVAVLGVAALYVVVVITENEALRSRLEQANLDSITLSLTDPLTGRGNRRRMDEDLERVHSRAGRLARPFSVVLFDVDHFKLYNDRYGHLGGDATLCAVVEDIAGVLRAYESVYRYGGEEFLVILADCDTDGAIAVAGRARQAVENAAMPHDCRPTLPLLVTVSAGVATWVPDCGLSTHDLIAQADAALYEAKSAGRNWVHATPATPQRPRPTQRVEPGELIVAR
jgi:diguanylate cyclase (GGDEF)-like protein